VTPPGLQSSAQPDEVSIAIAGVDSSALTTALACHAAGFSDITLLETARAGARTAPLVAPKHASVELSPNASRVLRTLKALDALDEHCFEPQFVHQRSYRTGFQLSILALGAMAEGRYNAPFLNIEHRHLNEVLEQLAQTRGIKRVVGEVQKLKQSSTGIEINLSNTQHQCDVLIVAADPEDQWRTIANAEALTRTPADATFWQGDVLESALPSGAFGPVVTQWLGPRHHLSYHFGARAQRLHFSAVTAAAPNEKIYNSAHGSSADPEPLLAALSDWHPSLRALADAAENLHREPVVNTSSPDRLAHGRIVFLGSSCHPMLPHLPQQTALGIEDAWVAARMLEQWEEDPASGWVEYEKYRLPRARRMQKQAQLLAQKLCEPSQAKAWQRNLGLSLSSRFLPELAMQKNDWLYGYDAVNGFE